MSEPVTPYQAKPASDALVAEMKRDFSYGTRTHPNKGLREIFALIARIDADAAELTRIRGPVCEHDGMRADVHSFWRGRLHLHGDYCAHRAGNNRVCGKAMGATIHDCTVGERGKYHDFQPSHPPSPAIEDWLRNRGER